MGLGKTKREVMSIVEWTLKKKGKLPESFNGEGWWIRFTQCHPNLSLCTADSLSRVRANAVTKDNMDRYYSLLYKVLVENGLPDKAAYLFNMDESGIPLDYKQPKRIAPKGMRKVHGLSSGNKMQITIVYDSAHGNNEGRKV